MKTRLSLVLPLVALLVLPAVAQADSPAAVMLILNPVSFDDHQLHVTQTKAGMVVTAEGMVGEATLACADEVECGFLNGKKVGIEQDLLIRIDIDHTSAGFKAKGRARGAFLLKDLSNAASFTCKVSVAPHPAPVGIGVEIEQVCSMSSYLNDRIRELNKVRLTLQGSIVQEDGVLWLRGVQGTGTASGNGPRK